MITIYHLAVSQSDRIVWLMEELDLPYKLEWYERTADTRFSPPEYRALHPVAMAPTIRDGDKVFCESVAIIQYIVNRYGNGRLSVPVEAPNYADYLYWFQFSTSLLANMAQLAAGDVTSSDPLRARYSASAVDREKRLFDYLELRVRESPYLAGPEFTAVDVQNMFALTSMSKVSRRPIENLPHVRAYIERVTQRPAYVRAMKIAGPNAMRPS